MKTYALDIIPRVKRFSEMLDSKSVLMNQRWVLIGNGQEKSVYIFRSKNELLVSVQGVLTKGSWELIDPMTVSITIEGKSFLMNHGFLDDKVLALKLDGRKEFAVFLNEEKFNHSANSLDDFLNYLNRKYIDKSSVAEERERTKKEQDEYDKRYENIYMILVLAIIGIPLLVILVKFFG